MQQAVVARIVQVVVDRKTSVMSTKATASRHKHYSENQDDNSYMDMDVNNVEGVPENVSENAAD